MASNNDRMCKLCFNDSKDFQVIGEITQEILDVLLLKMDFSSNNEAVICASCEYNIYKSFEFKSVCLYTEDRMVPLIRTMDSTKLDVVEVLYLKENSGDTISDPGNAICRLCLRKDLCVDLDTINEEFAEDIAAKCIPEVDIKSTPNPKICLSCRTSLESYYNFMSKCLVSQENMTRCNQLEACSDIKSEEVIIKSDEDLCDRNGNNSGPQWYSSMIHPDDREIKPYVRKPRNSGTNRTTTRPDSYQNALKIKVEDPSCDGVIEEIFGTSGEQACDYDTAQRYVRKRNISLHRDPSGMKSYHCKLCTYKTGLKRNANQHLLTHQDTSELRMYKCELCSYKSKWKSSVISHMVIHEDASKVPMYPCDICDFKTKYKRSLRKHIALHQAPPRGAYRCDMCPYNAKLKAYLIEHMLTHRDVSNVKTYQCTLCPHKTKRKQALQKHMLTHQEATVRCTMCPHITRRESDLKIHIMSKHQEATTYRCERCSFKTKWKRALSRHMLIHKDVSEVQSYDCKFCPYKTKYKGRLVEHTLIHENPSNIQYECAVCPYKTKWKNVFKSHLLSHKDDSETIMYECKFCPFKTKWKSSFKKHNRLFHRDAST